MSASNTVTLIGRLVRDPMVGATKNGTVIAKYTLAVDRGKKEDGVDFVGCFATGRTASFVEKFLKKGTLIAVNGEIRTGQYTDKNGNKKFTTDVMVNDHRFCESKKAAESQQNVNEVFDYANNIPDGFGDEVPFA